MRRRLRLAAVVLILVSPAAGTTPAAAAPFTPGLNDAYGFAVQYWHAEPTNCTSLDREIVPDEAIPGDEAMASLATQPGPCILWIRRTLASPRMFIRACAVMIHEVGHLLGYEHSEDPSNIMYRWIAVVPPYCFRVAIRESNLREARAR